MAVDPTALARKALGLPSRDKIFGEAFTAARAGYSDVAWESLAPWERTEAIYREMRRLDHDQARRPSAGSGHRRLKLVVQAPAD
ncbi:MAG TPA: hypothetical protein VGG99_29695 [Acetobacteraceae bacterium]|jgi:hypothetical protein